MDDSSPDTLLSELQSISQNTLTLFLRFAIFYRASKSIYYLQLARVLGYENAQPIFANTDIQYNPKQSFQKIQKEVYRSITRKWTAAYPIVCDDVSALQEKATLPTFQIDAVGALSFFGRTVDCTLIGAAAIMGSIQCFKFLLINRAKLDGIQRRYNESPLENTISCAVAGGNEEIIQNLLENNQALTGTAEIALEFHQMTVFRWLIDVQGVELNMEKRNAHLAAYGPQSNQISLYVLSGCYSAVEVAATVYQKKQDFDIWTTPMQRNDTDMLRYLLDHFQYNQGMTNAIKNGNLGIVRMIMPYCAEKDANSPHHLATAIICDKFDIADALWDKNSHSLGGVLEQAITEKHASVIDYLFGKNVDVNMHGNSTPLIAAIKQDNIELVQKLLKRGADPNMMSNDIFTPLMNVIHNVTHITNRALFVNALIDAGADINGTNSFNWTPIMMAANWRAPNLIELFINKRAKLNVINNQGQTCLSIAKQKSQFPGMLHAVELLEKNGAKDPPANFEPSTHDEVDLTSSNKKCIVQ